MLHKSRLGSQPNKQKNATQLYHVACSSVEAAEATMSSSSDLHCSTMGEQTSTFSNAHSPGTSNTAAVACSIQLSAVLCHPLRIIIIITTTSTQHGHCHAAHRHHAVATDTGSTQPEQTKHGSILPACPICVPEPHKGESPHQQAGTPRHCRSLVGRVHGFGTHHPQHPHQLRRRDICQLGCH